MVPDAKQRLFKAQRCSLAVEREIIEQARGAFARERIQLSSAILSFVPRSHVLGFAVVEKDEAFLSFVLSLGCSKKHLFSALTEALASGCVSLVPALLAALTAKGSDIFIPPDLVNNVLRKIASKAAQESECGGPAKRRKVDASIDNLDRIVALVSPPPVVAMAPESVSGEQALALTLDTTSADSTRVAEIGSPRSVAACPPLRSSGFAYDERMELHMSRKEHPETPERSIKVMQSLMKNGLLAQFERFIIDPASVDDLLMVHTKEYVDYILRTETQLAVPDAEHPHELAELQIGPDTYLNHHSAFAARLSASAAMTLSRAIAAGDIANGLAICRPPGHHADSSKASGFCIFNNAALAARAALEASDKVKRVLIFDWDVHHGNGTQSIFLQDKDVLFVSIHRFDGAFYPQTGAPSEIGVGEGKGYTVNIGIPCSGCSDADYAALFHHLVLPIATEFCPDMVIVSAGFDAMDGDPLGDMCLSASLYSYMTSVLSSLAKGRLLLIMEGGYEVDLLVSGINACAKVLLGNPAESINTYERPCRQIIDVIEQVTAVHCSYWSSLSPLRSGTRLSLHPSHSSSEESEELDCAIPQQQQKLDEQKPHVFSPQPGIDENSPLVSVFSPLFPNDKQGIQFNDFTAIFPNS